MKTPSDRGLYKTGFNTAHYLLRIVALVLVAVGMGCAPTMPKMNVNMPIEKRSVFLGKRYEQKGEEIDRQDMLSKLEQEPEAAEELSGYGVFNFFGIVFAGVGGGLIGWPIGEALAGSDDPLWILAAIGGGFVALAIPMAIVAENKVDNAVDAHNRRFGNATAWLRERLATPAWLRERLAMPSFLSKDFPTLSTGFSSDESLARLTFDTRLQMRGWALKGFYSADP